MMRRWVGCRPRSTPGRRNGMSFPGLQPQERRRRDRQPLRASAWLILGEHQVVAARTRDIGPTGCEVVCDRNLRVGTTLTLRVLVPRPTQGHAPFEATATVHDCTLAGREGGFRVDLLLDPLTPEAQQALQVLPH